MTRYESFQSIPVIFSKRQPYLFDNRDSRQYIDFLNFLKHAHKIFHEEKFHNHIKE